jgi:hypothetical protein
VLFVDDDNWLAPDAVQVATETMQAHPEVGACGGMGDAILSEPPPAWFARFARCYAVGAQKPESGPIEGLHAQLYGAALLVRVAAVRQLQAAQYAPMLTGRAGRRLTSGDDTELCFALRLAGWRLWYEARLRFSHALNPGRLEWEYLRRLNESFGAASVRQDAYIFQLSTKRPAAFRRSWWYQTGGAVKLLLIRALQGLRSDKARLGRAYAQGRLEELLRSRNAYPEMQQHVDRFVAHLKASTETVPGPTFAANAPSSVLAPVPNRSAG